MLDLLAGPPTQVWLDYPAEAQAWLEIVLSWAKWLGASLCVLGVVILGSMLAIDRNRGEAGIASSDQARALKWAFGVTLVAGASSIVAWFLETLPA